MGRGRLWTSCLSELCALNLQLWDRTLSREGGLEAQGHQVEDGAWKEALSQISPTGKAFKVMARALSQQRVVARTLPKAIISSEVEDRTMKALRRGANRPTRSAKMRE